MRVCLVGDFSEPQDEGMRNNAFYLARELAKTHEVLPANVLHVFTPGFWRSIREFNPQVIHYLSGPSLKSLVVVKVISLYCGHVKTVISATHPYLFWYSKALIPLLRPDLVLTISEEDRRLFDSFGCQTEFLPVGVDSHRFVPIAGEVKASLRVNYGLGRDKFIILHVGSVIERRGLRILEKMQGKGNKVVIVSSSSTGVERKMQRKMQRELEGEGCLVWTRYFENIEEIYALADCYVFPTTYRAASIRLPLSVLEAMACNLPVISTRFGALPEIFNEGDGLVFVDKEEDFIQGLERIKNGVGIRTREKVLPFSWENIAEKVVQTYEELIGTK